jgi:hypothetical protein
MKKLIFSIVAMLITASSWSQEENEDAFYSAYSYTVTKNGVTTSIYPTNRMISIKFGYVVIKDPMNTRLLKIDKAIKQDSCNTYHCRNGSNQPLICKMHKGQRPDCQIVSPDSTITYNFYRVQGDGGPGSGSGAGYIHR